MEQAKSLITLGDLVRIEGTNQVGRVIGYWVDEDGTTRFNVRYQDQNGVIREGWFGAAGITVTT